MRLKSLIRKPVPLLLILLELGKPLFVVFCKLGSLKSDLFGLCFCKSLESEDFSFLLSSGELGLSSSCFHFCSSFGLVVLPAGLAFEMEVSLELENSLDNLHIWCR